MPAAELFRVREGRPVRARAARRLHRQRHACGRLRRPIDPQTRKGLVYVDIGGRSSMRALRAGMFARGRFNLGRSKALTVPAASVLVRDGFSLPFQARRRQPGHAGEGRDRPPRGRPHRGHRGPEDPTRRWSRRGVGFLADGDIVAVAPEHPVGRTHHEPLDLVDPQPDPGAAAVHPPDRCSG